MKKILRSNCSIDIQRALNFSPTTIYLCLQKDPSASNFWAYIAETRLFLAILPRPQHSSLSQSHIFCEAAKLRLPLPVFHKITLVNSSHLFVLEVLYVLYFMVVILESWEGSEKNTIVWSSRFKIKPVSLIFKNSVVSYMFLFIQDSYRIPQLCCLCISPTYFC